jgi:hypothetical protein
MVHGNYTTTNITEPAAEEGSRQLYYNQHHRTCSWRRFTAITLQPTSQNLQLKKVQGHYTANNITEPGTEEGSRPLHYNQHHRTCSWRRFTAITLQPTSQNLQLKKVHGNYTTTNITEPGAEDGKRPLHYKQHHRTCSWRRFTAITLQPTSQNLQLKKVHGHYTTNNITEPAAEEGSRPLHYNQHHRTWSWRW